MMAAGPVNGNGIPAGGMGLERHCSILTCLQVQSYVIAMQMQRKRLIGNPSQFDPIALPNLNRAIACSDAARFYV